MTWEKTTRHKWEAAIQDLRTIESRAGIDGSQYRVAFTISDMALRKEFLHALDECKHRHLEHERPVVDEKKASLIKESNSIRSTHLWQAIGFGLLAVWMGNEMLSAIGALMGAVTGIIFGSSIQEVQTLHVKDLLLRLKLRYVSWSSTTLSIFVVTKSSHLVKG